MFHNEELYIYHKTFLNCHKGQFYEIYKDLFIEILSSDTSSLKAE